MQRINNKGGPLAMLKFMKLFQMIKKCVQKKYKYVHEVYIHILFLLVCVNKSYKVTSVCKSKIQKAVLNCLLDQKV